MPDHTASEVELLRAAYAAFNARDIHAALALMTTDVAWPRAFKGGFVRGHEEVRAYWREQWSEIDPHGADGFSLRGGPAYFCRCASGRARLGWSSSGR
jgi:ketosteroid isomerase-like protein